MTRKKSDSPPVSSRQLQLDGLFGGVVPPAVPDEKSPNAGNSPGAGGPSGEEGGISPAESGAKKPAGIAVRASQAPPVFTVSELIADVNRRLRAYGNQVWVEGELGQVGEKNGVFYFSIKDAKAALDCVLFQRHAALPFELKQGVSVLVRGYLEVYPARGKFTLVVESIEPRGEGALLLAFLQLKKKLEAEGLFEKPRRRLPLLPRVVGVVTSESGAAFQDILKIARRRVGCRILLSDCLVQGSAAPLSIIAALKLVESRSDVEVIILARGGGSMEDLACFNDEGVVRAVHACRVPIVTAIGHQTDTTLVDFVSDVRAATPTEAAELVFADGQLLVKRMETVMARCTRAVSLRVEQSRRRLAETRLPEPQVWFNRQMRAVAEAQARLDSAIRRHQEAARARMDAVARRLDRVSPQVRLMEWDRQLQEARTRMQAAVELRMRMRGELLSRLSARLEALSPLAVLERGYAVVTSASGRFVRNAGELSPGDSIGIRLARGSVRAVVDGVDLAQEEKAP